MALRDMVGHLRQMVAHNKQALQLAYEQRVLCLRLFAVDPEVLRKARVERTQREVAERAGLKQARVSEIERGQFDRVGNEKLLRVLETYCELEGGGC
jgi:hypothetical protein